MCKSNIFNNIFHSEIIEINNHILKLKNGKEIFVSNDYLYKFNPQIGGEYIEFINGVKFYMTRNDMN